MKKSIKNYDNLFEYGLYIGVKKIGTDKVYYHLCTEENNFSAYNNSYLSFSSWVVQKVIRLNNDGEITEVLFDRNKDMRPELESGMFIEVFNKEYMEIPKIGIVIDNRVVYQTGSFDWIDEQHEFNVYNDITKIWDKNTTCFDACEEDGPIWVKTE